MSDQFTPRLDAYAAAPELFAQFSKFAQSVHHAGLDPKLLALVEIRASQINGCAFCLDMHSKQAKLLGEREIRLYALPAWHESPLYSERERAALKWTETLTRIADHGVDDAVFAEVSRHFTQTELAQLTLAIGIINTWNRVAISFRAPPGAMDKQFGLDKAGLH